MGTTTAQRFNNFSIATKVAPVQIQVYLIPSLNFFCYTSPSYLIFRHTKITTFFTLFIIESTIGLLWTECLCPPNSYAEAQSLQCG